MINNVINFFNLLVTHSKMNHQLNELRGLEHAWISKMKGSIAQNIDYCTKESELFEFGTRPHYSGILLYFIILKK